MMRADENRRMLHWRLDPEHEAFRGLGVQSGLRLGAVLATIVSVLMLIVISLPSSVASRHPLQGFLGQSQLSQGVRAPG
jgi:hypothetical protein